MTVDQLFGNDILADAIVHFEDVLDNLKGINSFSYDNDVKRGKTLAAIRGTIEDCIGTVDLNAKYVPFSRTDYTAALINHFQVIVQGQRLYQLADAIDWSIPAKVVWIE
jgi:hypothetical protein